MFEREMEYVAPKAKTGAETGILTASWVIIITLVAVIVKNVSWIGGICAMLVVIPFYLNKRFTKDYAYVLTGDRLTVSIVDYKGGKTPVGGQVFLENLVVCAKEDDEKYNSALKDTYSSVIDARTSLKSKTAAFAVFERDGEKTLVRFEPVEMMISEMKKYAKDKIFI